MVSIFIKIQKKMKDKSPHFVNEKHVKNIF